MRLLKVLALAAASAALLPALAAQVAPSVSETPASGQMAKQDRANPPDAPAPEEIPVILLVDLANGQTLYSREPVRRFVPCLLYTSPSPRD